MAVNKVILGDETLLDLTGDTATAADVASGKTFHLASGLLATGTASVGSKVFYGTCATAAATAAKVVVCEEFASADLVAGTVIFVKFTNAQTYNGAPTLNVQSTGAKNIKRVGTTNAARYEWLAGEVLSFVYDGSYWVLTDGGFATTTYYGVTKLATSATSTSAALALTPASLNNFALEMVSGYPVYSTSSTYAVGDRVRYGYSTYECTTAIATAEAWTAAHWTELLPIQQQVDAKQDVLVSGTSIKTVNGNSLLGSGDLIIDSGSDVAMTEAEVTAAFEIGWPTTSASSVTVTLTNPRYPESAGSPPCTIYESLSGSADSLGNYEQGEILGYISSTTGGAAIDVDDSLYGIVVTFSGGAIMVYDDDISCTGDVSKIGVKKNSQVLFKVDGDGAATIPGVNYDW